MTRYTRIVFSTAAAFAVGAAALGVGSPAHAATPTPTPVLAATIIQRAVGEGKQQFTDQDYTRPLDTPRRKFLILALTDVEFTNDGSSQRINADERVYTKSIVDQTVKIFAERLGVTLDVNLVFDDTPLIVTSTDRSIHEQQILDRITSNASPAQYDSIMVTSNGNNGGVTMASYYDDAKVRGSGYSYFSLRPDPSKPGYPGTYADADITTNILLHEFSHQMEFNGVGFPYVGLHGSYGYTADPTNELFQYYLDYLSGKVLSNGKRYGAFPKMWPVSQRFLHHPAMLTAHFIDTNGKTLSPDQNTYGVAGDPYSLTPPTIPGYAAPVVSASGAPAASTYIENAQQDVTFVYPAAPVVDAPVIHPAVAGLSLTGVAAAAVLVVWRRRRVRA